MTKSTDWAPRRADDNRWRWRRDAPFPSPLSRLLPVPPSVTQLQKKRSVFLRTSSFPTALNRDRVFTETGLRPSASPPSHAAFNSAPHPFPHAA